MTKKTLDTRQEPVSCAVCGRSLLRGEHANTFIAGGARRIVCELCTPRAVHDGWVREGDGAVPAGRPRSERGPSLVGRLRARREEGLREAGRGPGEDAVPDGGVQRARERRRVHAVPTNVELKAARAIELFNSSEHPRTVAGIARSLGGPAVSVRPLDNGGRVEVLVAWELCWYRYEVDLADEDESVRLLAQGDELAELGEALRTPNAAADARGELTLAVAPSEEQGVV